VADDQAGPGVLGGAGTGVYSARPCCACKLLLIGTIKFTGLEGLGVSSWWIASSSVGLPKSVLPERTRPAVCCVHLRLTG
jgi:hypothetical protein